MIVEVGMGELLRDAGNVGIIVIAVGFLLQAIIPSLRGDNGGSKQMLKDLHRWLAPDSRGIQTWKNTELMESVERLVAAVDKLEQTVAELVEVIQERRTL